MSVPTATTGSGTKPTLTYAEVVADLHALVEEYGADHTYTKPDAAGVCKYAHPDGPGCIVGHVLARHGVALDHLRALDNAPEGSSVDDVIQFGLLPFAVDFRTEHLLSYAQSEQDGGEPWGPAVARALADVDPASA